MQSLRSLVVHGFAATLFFGAIFGIGFVSIDGDTLPIGVELVAGASIGDTDTDGDGLPDGAELGDKVLDGASPTRYDVFLEIDTVGDASLTPTERRGIQETFKEAPLRNPDGSSGITVHLVNDSPSTASRNPSFTEYYDTVHNTSSDYAGRGYHHVLIVEDINQSVDGVVGLYEANGDVAGEGMLVEDDSVKNRTGMVLLHEWGHASGLAPTDYEGIDSSSVSYEEYRSVMNYNHPCLKTESCSTASYRFSASGESFDDWTRVIVDETNTVNAVGHQPVVVFDVV